MKKKYYQLIVEDMADGDFFVNAFEFLTIEAAKHKMEQEKQRVLETWADGMEEDDLEVEEGEKSFFINAEDDDYYTKADISEKHFEDE